MTKMLKNLVQGDKITRPKWRNNKVVYAIYELQGEQVLDEDRGKLIIVLEDCGHLVGDPDTLIQVV